MSGTDSDVTEILNFATQVGNPDTPPEETARKCGWIDGDGDVTSDGRDLLKSLGDQEGTRSAFR